MMHTRTLAALARASFALAAFAAMMMPGPAQAQAVLNPGLIKGTIAVTGETIVLATINASWTDTATGNHYSARTSLNGGGSYSLSVHVPSGVTAEYTLTATVRLNGNESVLVFPAQFAEVTASGETIKDFAVTPGYIHATVTSTSGTVNSMSVSAFSGGGGASQGSGPGGSLTFPVLPGDAVSVFGNATFTASVATLATVTVPVGAGQTVAVSWTVSPPPPPGLGAVSGTFTFAGLAPVQTALNVGCGSSGSQSLLGNGSFSFPSLVSGPCIVTAYSYFNDGSYLYLPDSSFTPSRSQTLTTGGAITVDIAGTAAFLNGTVELTGAASLAQATDVSLTASGASTTVAANGSAGTPVNPQTGEYRLVATPGGWSVTSLNFALQNLDPAAYLQEYLTYFDTQASLNATVLSAGETRTKNLSYDTGKVTINFRVAGGGTLSNPSLFGTCSSYGPDGQETSSYLFSSYGDQVDVTQGRVSFVGMAGTCLIEAWADVADSFTRFGVLSFEVVPRTEVEVDLNGPTLIVTFPPAGHITTDAVITVIGSASDDVAITTVTVNGTPATLTPAGPAPQVSFAFPLALNLGPNQIVTVATDSDGLTASDTRTVYRVAAPINTPPVVSLAGATDVLSGSTSIYTFTVTDPDAGATFTVTSVSCGANGNQAGATTTTAAGGSLPCAFSGEATTTLSVQVTDNGGAPSNVATLLVTVAKTPTTTVVSCPSNVAYTGAAQTPCTATVTSAAGLNQTVPVTYTANLNAGTATASAAYPGDLDHHGSEDSKTFAIDPIGSATVVSCPVSVDYTGTARTPCTATVTSEAGLSQSLTVTYTDHVNAGTATASAAYSGDGNHTASDASGTFAITPIASVTVVTCPVSVNYSGAAHTPCTATVTSADGLSQSLTVTHTANVNAGAATATAAYSGDGNHTASDDSATFAITPIASVTVVTCPVSVNYTGAAHTPCTAVATSADGLSQSLTVTYTNNLDAGPATANAAYSGDANHAASDGSATFAITAIPSVTVVTCPVSATYSGAALTPCTAIATAADGLGEPLVVNYAMNINTGTATASAAYAGDANHGASSHSTTFAITPLATATVVTCPVSVDYTGAAHTPCTAKVTAPDGLNQSLTVTHTANLNAGTATGSAAYAGDSNHLASNHSATFAINPLATTTVVTCPVSVYYDASPQTPCSATVTAADGFFQTPAVNYANNVNPGTANASASFSGDGNHSASSGTTTFAIEPNATTPTTTSVEAPTITYAADGTVTVAVQAATGVVTGNVSLRVDGGAAQTKTLVAGSATFTVVRPNAGNHALSASFAAQGNFGASNATGTLIVNQSPTATTLTSSPNPSSLGQLVTLTAIVTAVAPGSGVPVGSVIFKDGTTVLGTVVVNAAGRAVLTTSSLALGPHSLTAAYSGNANYKPSSASASHLVFAYASGGGTFAIGDRNSAVGTQVTFWGAQWWKLNSLSGVAYSPAAFKGYITTPLPSPPVVGGTWRTDPGNSSNPPASIPTYLAVVVTSSTTKSGSLIAGNVVGIAIVRTNPGYAGNPGHAGSGTIVAVIR